MNSTDLLLLLRELDQPGNACKPVALKVLGERTGLTPAKLVAILTELEHRDEIILEIKTNPDPATGDLLHSGTVQLMEHPLEK